MKPTLFGLTLVVLLGSPLVPAVARDMLPYETTQVLELKDGSTVYVFKDGQMAKEDRLGRTEHLKPGEILVLKDGRKVKAVGNEVQRLKDHLEHDLRG